MLKERKDKKRKEDKEVERRCSIPRKGKIEIEGGGVEKDNIRQEKKRR